MAKNISLMGANYPQVPAVQLPQTGGGMATFYDIEVYDGLDSNDPEKALSAKQGKVLNDKLTNTDLTITRTENAYANADSIGRLNANKKAGYLFLKFNLGISSAGSPGDLTEIARISGWNALHGIELTIPPQNGSNKIMLAQITSDGIIKIWGANGLDSGFYRSSIVVPEA